MSADSLPTRRRYTGIVLARNTDYLGWATLKMVAQFARVAESVDAGDSKSPNTRVLYEFESRPGYCLFIGKWPTPRRVNPTTRSLASGVASVPRAEGMPYCQAAGAARVIRGRMSRSRRRAPCPAPGALWVPGIVQHPMPSLDAQPRLRLNQRPGLANHRHRVRSDVGEGGIAVAPAGRVQLAAHAPHRIPGTFERFACS